MGCPPSFGLGLESVQTLDGLSGLQKMGGWGGHVSLLFKIFLTFKLPTLGRVRGAHCALSLVWIKDRCLLSLHIAGLSINVTINVTCEY